MHELKQNAVSLLATAFLVFCTSVYLLTAPGRIQFPDDEIVFQTTRSLWESGELAVEGIGKRTGEPKGRPDGTFGWAPGRDGRRYGFFGHALSVVALPAYGLGKLAAASAPAPWRHAIRSDQFFFHPRSTEGDWTRLVVTLTNTLVTALGAWMLVAWLRTLGHRLAPAIGTGLAYAFGTAAWAYSGTFLSEPLSALVLLGGAWAIAHYHRGLHASSPGRFRWLWLAAALAGLSVHVHVLNVVAIPCLVAYAGWPVWRRRSWRDERKAWVGALLLGTAGLAALAWGQWLRFGDPFETGRYGHYSHFIVPGEGLLAMLVSPGRSVFLVAPILVLGLAGARRAWRRDPLSVIFVAALVSTRMVFVAARSDWWGGWAIGPRFMMPVLGFGLLGLAELLTDPGPRRWRWAVVGTLAVSVAMQAHLALHCIFEWMLHLYQSTPKEIGYLHRSHWEIDASPLVGFFGLQLDTLSAGAVRLAHHGHPGLAVVFAGVGLVAVASGGWLAVRLWRLRGDP